MKKIYTLSIAFVLSIFVFNNDAFATDYYLRTGAGAITLATNWTDAVNGTGGTSPGNFAGNHIWHFANRASGSLTSIFGAATTATVSIENGFNLTVSNNSLSGGTINSKIDIVAGGTLTIQNGKNYNFNNLDNNSTVVFQFATQYLKSYYFGNVVIATSTKIIGGAPNPNPWLYGTLTINSGQTLALNGNGLFLNGYTSSISGAGTITGDALAGIVLLGGNGGNNGTINFTSGSNFLNEIDVQYDNPASYVTLGNDLTIQNGLLNDQIGGIDLNGKTLTIDPTSDANFPLLSSDGGIKGNANSSLILNGTIGALSGSSDLFMDPAANTLKVLSINSADPLNLGNALNITDSLSISGSTFKTLGFLTLKSTDALKGRIAEIKSGGAIIGDITVETFARAGSTGWTNLGPSGVGGLTISSWDGQIPMSCNGCINDAISAGGYFVSVQGDANGDGTYTELTGSTPLNPGTGYWIYLGNGQTTTTDMVWTVTGPVVTGSKGSGTGFISNPYPSPISLPRLQATNAGMGAIDVYNPDNGTFTTFNGGIPSNGIIPMGQGFYITAGATINFLESHKVSYNTSANPLLKTTTPSSYIGSVFQLQVQGANGDLDNTYLRFHGNATPGFDIDLDGYKKFATPGYLGYPGPYSKYTTISTKVGTADYSINSLPYANTSNAVIPVMVKVSATGTYSIVPIDIANLPSGACVVLKDKLLNVTHDLRTGAYVCSINDTTSTARFELTICADVTAGISSLSVDQNTTLINQDQNGAYVKTSFETNTKATISAYNIMGQKLMADKEIEGKDLTTYLDLGDVHSQVVIIRVTTAKKNTTKKIFIN